MSGAQTSTFGNVLFNPMMAREQTASDIANQRNQLLMPYQVQGAAQQVGEADMAAVGQASQALLNNYPDEASRAAAYPGLVADLQRQGFARNAPSVYPGEQALKTIVARSLPVQTQYNLGLATDPTFNTQLQQILHGGTPGATPPAAPGGGTTDFNYGNIRPTGASSGFNTYATPQDGIAAMSSLLKTYQTDHGITTLNGLTARWAPKGDGANDPVAYAKALGVKLGIDPDAPINLADPMLQTRLIPAMAQIEKGRPFNQPPEVLTAGIQAGLSGKGGTTVAVTGPSGGVVARNPGSVQVAGPGAPTGSTAPAQADLVGPRPLPPTGPGSPVATPASIANTPYPVAQNVLAPQPPPAAPQTPPPQQPPAQPPGPQANLPHAWEVPTGQQSAQFQQARQLEDQAAQLTALAARYQPNSPQARQALAYAASLTQRATELKGLDTIVQTQEGPVHVLTGQQDKPIAPLPHYVYDPTQHAYIDTTGTNKPEFEPAQRDTAVAQRDVMELGPKVANGTATPDEVARYNVAATTYQQPTLRENPVTKETVRVNTRELPPGFPDPTKSGGGATPAGAGTAPAGTTAPGGASGSQVVMPGLSPAQQQIERDPAAYKVAASQYDRDSKEIAGIADAGRQAQADQMRINEMQNVLQSFSSGPGTEWRTAASSFLQRWLPSAVTGWEKESQNLSGAEAAQVFAKLAVTGAGSQERSVLGNRGGFQAIKMFSAANPNVDLNDATNKAILDMQLITNQANQDYSLAAQRHFAQNEQTFGGPTHQYNSLAQFDTQWNAQRQPQVYAAAMGAISGQPASQWAKGLSDDEYARALQIVQRAKPSAVVQTKNGPYSMQPNAVTPAPSGTATKVIRFDHNGNVIQ